MTVRQKIETYLARILDSKISCENIHPREKDGRYVAVAVDEDGKRWPILTPFHHRSVARLH